VSEVLEDIEGLDAALATEPPAPPVDPDRKWYVIHTYSGYENKFKDGKRREVEKKVYPGYVLVEMKMTDASWYVVRNTQGVTGFVGSPGAGEKPLPLAEKEVKTILKQMGIETPKLKIDFKRGDRVKVTSGPFFDFTGTVDEIDAQKERLRALISIFGRETPVELEFYQVEKV
jgi:transcriptional antiterminator NusG